MVPTAKDAGMNVIIVIDSHKALHTALVRKSDGPSFAP